MKHRDFTEFAKKVIYIYIYIQDGARKTGPPSRRPTWA